MILFYIGCAVLLLAGVVAAVVVHVIDHKVQMRERQLAKIAREQRSALTTEDRVWLLDMGWVDPDPFSLHFATIARIQQAISEIQTKGALK